MTELKRANGWLQLMFAGPNDIYQLPSLIRVDLRRYLFYCLRKSGFQGVFFWERPEQAPVLRIPDLPTSQVYEQSLPKKKLFRTAQYGELADAQGIDAKYDWAEAWVEDDEALVALLQRLMSTPAPNAVVVSLGEFERLFRSPELLSWLRRQHREAGSAFTGLLLITATDQCADSCRYLTDPDCALVQLFPELKQALKPDIHTDLYLSLRQWLGKRCTVLLPTAERLEPVLTQALLFEPENKLFSWQLERLPQLCQVMARSAVSAKLRQKLGYPFPPDWRPTVESYDQLFHTVSFTDCLKTFLDSCGIPPDELFAATLRLEYPEDEELPFLQSDNPLLSRWQRIESQLSHRSDAGELVPAARKIRVMLRNLSLRGPIPEERTEIMLGLLESVNKSVLRTDGTGRIRHKLIGLRSYLDNYYDACSKDYLTSCQAMFGMVEQLVHYDNLIRNSEAAAARCKLQFEQYRAQAKTAPTEAQRTEAKDNALRCHQQNMNYEAILNRQRQERSSWQSNLDQMEQLLGTDMLHSGAEREQLAEYTQAISQRLAETLSAPVQPPTLYDGVDNWQETIDQLAL